MKMTRASVQPSFAAIACVLAMALIGASVSCVEEDEGPRSLAEGRDCVSDDECQGLDARYDVCSYVCAGDVTYCRVSCENSQDCLDRGLPEDYVYCNHPRDGEGFCFFYDYAYDQEDCVADPGTPGDSGDSGSDCYSSCVDACLEAGGTNCGADCADIC